MDSFKWQEKGRIKRAGPLLPAVKCPHCETVGQVRGKTVTSKSGVSGGKASAAILTGGLSVLATGLSRKSSAMELMCGNCTVRWTA